MILYLFLGFIAAHLFWFILACFYMAEVEKIDPDSEDKIDSDWAGDLTRHVYRKW